MNTRAFHTTITTPYRACSYFCEILTNTVQLLKQLLHQFTNDTLTNLTLRTISFIGPDICAFPLLPMSSNEPHNHTTYDHDHDDLHDQSSPRIVEDGHYDPVCHCPSFPILAEPHDTHETPLTKLPSCPAVVPTTPVRTIHRKQRSYDLRDDYLQTSLSRRGTPCPNPRRNDEDISHHDDHTDDSNDPHLALINNRLNRPASWPYLVPFPLYKCKIFHSETS